MVLPLEAVGSSKFRIRGSGELKVRVQGLGVRS